MKESLKADLNGGVHGSQEDLMPPPATCSRAGQRPPDPCSLSQARMPAAKGLSGQKRLSQAAFCLGGAIAWFWPRGYGQK